MPKYVKLCVGFSIMALCAATCSHPQREFLAVQVCLGSEVGSSGIAKIMRDTASSEGLAFLDGSTKTRDYLNDVRNKGLVKLDHVPTVNMGIEGEDGLGVTASNLGLPQNQVALGFTAGHDPAKAQKLANHLVRALSHKYHVEKVPHEQGSFPLTSCNKVR